MTTRTAPANWPRDGIQQPTRMELLGEKLRALIIVVAFLILWACFTGLLGPLGLLVGWVPAIFLAPL